MQLQYGTFVYRSEEQNLKRRHKNICMGIRRTHAAQTFSQKSELTDWNHFGMLTSRFKPDWMILRLHSGRFREEEEGELDLKPETGFCMNS